MPITGPVTVPRQIAIASWACLASASLLTLAGSSFDLAQALSALIQLQAFGVVVLGVWGIGLSLRRGDAMAGLASTAAVVAFLLVVFAFAVTADWQ
jgi:hypothetical protein